MRTARIVLALCFCVSVALAQAINFPAQTGRVTDEAGILDPSIRAALIDKLAALEAKNTSQLFVATVKSLQGGSIEDYANRLFRLWGIGQKGVNNGVLLLVAPNERKVRIEVGYGLEGTLTDAQTKLIIENVIIPRFRAGDFPGGILRGVDNLVALMAAEPAGAIAPSRDLLTLPTFTHDQMALLWIGGFMAFWCLGVFFVMRNNMRHHPGLKAAHRGSERSTSSRWSSDSSSWSSSGSSSSSDSSSGGGGDSGGGGASGSW